MEFNLADLFERVADAVPGRTALCAEGRTLTYRELDQRANRLAHHFTAVGIGLGADQASGLHPAGSRHYRRKPRRHSDLMT